MAIPHETGGRDRPTLKLLPCGRAWSVRPPARDPEQMIGEQVPHARQDHIRSKSRNSQCTPGSMSVKRGSTFICIRSGQSFAGCQQQGGLRAPGARADWRAAVALIVMEATGKLHRLAHRAAEPGGLRRRHRQSLSLAQARRCAWPACQDRQDRRAPACVLWRSPPARGDAGPRQDLGRASRIGFGAASGQSRRDGA